MPDPRVWTTPERQVVVAWRAIYRVFVCLTRLLSARREARRAPKDRSALRMESQVYGEAVQGFLLVSEEGVVWDMTRCVP